MKITEEKGVTLLVLVTTIIILLILTSIGVTSGISTLNSAKFSQFKEELKILQTKVNELNQNDEINLGEELTETQKNILNIIDISKIIYNDKTEEEKKEIQNGFRYFNNESLKNELDLEGIKRDYLINFKYRYIVCYKGVEYNGTTYYMSEQIENTYYNVQYKDKNEKSGSFEVNTTKEDNKWKIEIYNIVYSGYINNWEIKYKLKDDSYWKTSNSLIFYLDKEGIYNINVKFKDEVDLGIETVKLISDGSIADKVKNNIIKIGDYVKYEPDEVKTTDTSYINLIDDLKKYSGNTDTTQNTVSTITQENLNWRVLDIVKDKNGNDCVRLISEISTKNLVRLEGYNGYNNAVYLIDKMCNTLYNNSKYAKNVQNLKIEDIQEYMKVKDYSTINETYGITYSPATKYYPNILIEEKNQTITTSDATKQPTTRLDLSEQTNPINQIKSNQVSSWTLKDSLWYKRMLPDDFEYSIYYNLFIKDGINNYSVYWLSSRCIDITEFAAAFYVRTLNLEHIGGYYVYYSNNTARGNAYSIRPVVTLNSDILININQSGDGSQDEKAWILKSE